MKEDKPKYNHDCSLCAFLGHYKEQDLYFCPQFDSKMPTVIARSSDEPSDYTSGWIFAITNPPNDFLREALYRAYQNDMFKLVSL